MQEITSLEAKKIFEETFEKMGLKSIICEVVKKWKLKSFFLQTLPEDVPRAQFIMEMAETTNYIEIKIMKGEPQEIKEQWTKYGFEDYKTVFSLYVGAGAVEKNFSDFYKINSQERIIVRIRIVTSKEISVDELQREIFGTEGIFINPTMYDKEGKPRGYTIIGKSDRKTWGKK